MTRLRYADELVGLLVILAVVLFLGVAFQAGVLSRWFRTTEILRIVLPEQGSAGLSPGADVEVLGTKAGQVRRVVINPDQQMYAEADIEEQARAFIRRDSVGVIRKRFGVAGAAYLDISRGKGKNLDWGFAVIQGVTERDPTESIGSMIDQVREKVFPILDGLGSTTRGLAELVDSIKKGQGNIGRLLADQTLVKRAEGTVGSVQDSVAKLDPIIADLNEASRNIAQLTRNVGAGQGSVPALLQRTNQILVSLQGVMQDLGKAMQRLPPIAHNVEGSTSDLPSLLTQTQQTVHDLDLLIAQMRGSWLLGGGPSAPSAPRRLPSTEVLP
jgi:phospholipid/cholesterol/gamma-HCH transport system substrate-binding protein